MRRWIHRRELGLVLLGGFSFALAFPPWNLWPLIALHILVLFELCSLEPKEALGYGWLCGGLSLGLTQNALGLGVASFFGMHVALTTALFTCGILLAGASTAALTWLGSLATQRGQRWLLPGLLAACEVLFTVTPGPLPVGIASASSLPLLLGPADLGGTFLLSLLWAVVVWCGWRAARERRGLPALLALVVVAAWLGYSALRWNGGAPEVGTLRVALVQGNYPYRTFGGDFDPLAQTEYQLRLSRDLGPGDLVVWPESSLPVWVEAGVVGLRPRFLPFGPGWQAGALIACGFESLPPDGFSPTAWLFEPSGRIVGRAAKRHMVWGGERFPGQTLFPGLYAQEGVDFPTPRALTSTVFVDSLAVFINICCEDGYAQTSERAYEEGPGLLVNLTNANWFGRWNGPALHQTAAILRSVETRLWAVRATNTGLTSVISPNGEVVAALPPHRPGVLRFEVPVRAGPDGLYGRVGWSGLRLLSALLVLVVLLRLRGADLRAGRGRLLLLAAVLAFVPLLRWLEEPPDTPPAERARLAEQAERLGWE